MSAAATDIGAGIDRAVDRYYARVRRRNNIFHGLLAAPLLVYLGWVAYRLATI